MLQLLNRLRVSGGGGSGGGGGAALQIEWQFVVVPRARAPHSLPPLPELNLDYIMDNPWIVVPISALRQTNIDRVLEWLIRQK